MKEIQNAETVVPIDTPPVIGSIHSIPLSAIHPMPNNPFQIRDDPAMNELIESVSQFGILVPAKYYSSYRVHKGCVWPYDEDAFCFEAFVEGLFRAAPGVTEGPGAPFFEP